MLEHEAHAALASFLIRDVLAIEFDRAGIRELQSGDDAQQRRLSAAGRTEQGHQLTVRYFQSDVLERRKASELLRDVAHADAHGFSSSPASVCCFNCWLDFHSTTLLTTRVIESQQREKRRDRECGDKLIIVVKNLDVQRHRVGEPADVAGNDRYRAKLSHGARIAENHAVQQGPLDVRQRHSEKGLPAACAQRERGLFLIIPLGLNHGQQLARDERERNENRREHDSGNGEDDPNAVRDQPWPEKPLQAEKQHVDQS